MSKPFANPGEFVILWHDTGCFGWSPIYGKVIKVSPTFAYVLFEHAEHPRRIMWHKIEAPKMTDGIEEVWRKNANKKAVAKWCEVKL
jgi:hypothetical protein